MNRHHKDDIEKQIYYCPCGKPINEDSFYCSDECTKRWNSRWVPFPPKCRFCARDILDAKRDSRRICKICQIERANKKTTECNKRKSLSKVN
jgi:hypothetical protein